MRHIRAEAAAIACPLLVASLLALSGCTIAGAGAQEPPRSTPAAGAEAATVTATPWPTVTQLPRPTIVLGATPTVVPQATATPLPTHTPVPEQATPAPTAVSIDMDPAVETLLDYWMAVKQRAYEQAYRYWAGDGQASGQSYEAFAQGFADTRGLTVLLGPVSGEGKAVSVGITLIAVADAPEDPLYPQHAQYYQGTCTLEPSGDAWRITHANMVELPAGTPPAEVADPLTLLQGYFQAINHGEFARAYTCWEQLGQASGQTFGEFRRGFANTEHVDAQLGEPRGSVAAGTAYAEVPVFLEAIEAGGVRRSFSGSYVLRLANVPPFDQFGWRIEKADVAAVEN